MIISLEGNIGAGKSTLLSQIKNLVFEKPHVVAFEPVDDWMNLRASPTEKSLFELYYEDKKRYGFTFQMYALQSRFQHLVKLMEENPDKIIICERCHLTDCEVFANMLLKQGIITSNEYAVYMSWYTFITNILKPKIMGIIYLQVRPSLCVERICSRNRTGEDNIDFTYLRKLHTQHEEWLTQNESRYPICVIDGNDHGHTWDMNAIVEFVNTTIKNIA